MNYIKNIPILSKVLISISHPLAMPALIALIMLFGDTYFNASHLTPYFKLLLLWNILFFTLVVPLCVTTLAFFVIKYILKKSYSILNERITLVLMAIICFFVAMFWCAQYITTPLSRILFLPFIVVATISTIASFFTRVDMQSSSLGIVAAFISCMQYSGYGQMFIPIVFTLLITGLVISARLYLNLTTLPKSALCYTLGYIFALATIYAGLY